MSNPAEVFIGPSGRWYRQNNPAESLPRYINADLADAMDRRLASAEILIREAWQLIAFDISVNPKLKDRFHDFLSVTTAVSVSDPMDIIPDTSDDGSDPADSQRPHR